MQRHNRVARGAALRTTGSRTACALLGLASVALACGCNDALQSPKAVYEKVRFENYLKASSPQVGARLGQNLTMDETTLVAAAPFETIDSASGESVEHAGALYVFDATNPGSPPHRLVAPNADADDGSFPPALVPGYVGGDDNWGAMPLALDGDWIAVGTPGEDSGKSVGPDVTLEEAEADNDALEAGAVYLYRRSQLDDAARYLKAPNPSTDDMFGMSVAFADGWLAVGAIGESSGDPEDDTNTDAPWSGAVYVYRYDSQSDDFTFVQMLKAPGIHSGDLFGASISIEGDLMVVGAHSEDGGGVGVNTEYDDQTVQDSGAVYAFRRNGEKWEFESYLKPEVPDAGAKFGWYVRLFDGHLAVSAPFSSYCPGAAGKAWNGSVYVFERKDDAWGDYQCLAAPDAASLFGFTLAGYRSRLIVGAVWQPPGQSGGAHSYELDDAGKWQQRPMLVAPNPDKGDGFGAAVGINSHAIAVGAFGESGAVPDEPVDVVDNGAMSSGAVYVFSM